MLHEACSLWHRFCILNDELNIIFSKNWAKGITAQDFRVKFPGFFVAYISLFIFLYQNGSVILFLLTETKVFVICLFNGQISRKKQVLSSGIVSRNCIGFATFNMN